MKKLFRKLKTDLKSSTINYVRLVSSDESDEEKIPETRDWWRNKRFDEVQSVLLIPVETSMSCSALAAQIRENQQFSKCCDPRFLKSNKVSHHFEERIENKRSLSSLAIYECTAHNYSEIQRVESKYFVEAEAEVLDAEHKKKTVTESSFQDVNMIQDDTISLQLPVSHNTLALVNTVSQLPESTPSEQTRTSESKDSKVKELIQHCWLIHEVANLRRELTNANEKIMEHDVVIEKLQAVQDKQNTLDTSLSKLRTAWKEAGKPTMKTNGALGVRKTRARHRKLRNVRKRSRMDVSEVAAPGIRESNVTIAEMQEKESNKNRSTSGKRRSEDDPPEAIEMLHVRSSL